MAGYISAGYISSYSWIVREKPAIAGYISIIFFTVHQPPPGGYIQKKTLVTGGVLPKGDLNNEQWDYPGSPVQTSGNVI